jgi:hypothetical protein
MRVLGDIDWRAKALRELLRLRRQSAYFCPACLWCLASLRAFLQTTPYGGLFDPPQLLPMLDGVQYLHSQAAQILMRNARQPNGGQADLGLIRRNPSPDASHSIAHRIGCSVGTKPGDAAAL